MNIRFISFLILLFFSITASSQEYKWSFGAQLDNTFFPSKKITGIGINFDKMIQPKISIGYTFLFGQSSTDNTYLFSGIGQTSAFYALKNISKPRADALAIQLLFLGIILPENFNYHFRLTDKIKGSAFLSPYGFEYEKNYSSKKEQYAISFEYGLRLHFIKNNKFAIVPQLGLKSHYSRSFRELAITGGVSASLLKYSKTKPE